MLKGLQCSYGRRLTSSPSPLMKIQLRTRRGRLCPGVTLIELTVMIAVLLVVISILLIGGSSWKAGADRSNCILNIRQVQLVMRSYQNYYNHHEGDDISPVNLQGELMGPSGYISTPLCPSNGIYSYGGNVIPAKGTLYLSCSLDGGKNHVPPEHDAW